jgi:predicted  nucleic acid-binding Zn-ribbon protein
MAELNEVLMGLGRCERRIEELQHRKRRLPEAIEAELGLVQRARDTIEERRQGLAEAEKTRRGHESALADLEARRQKFQGQTALVKTNEEYSTLLREIDATGDEISKVEDAILESLERVERLSGEIGEVERAQRELEQTHQRRAEALRAELAGVERELEEALAEREQRAEGLPEPLDRRFAVQLAASGSGTAGIAGRSCGRCHRDIPFEVINRVLAGEGQSCGNCGRILVPVEARAEPEAALGEGASS